MGGIEYVNDAWATGSFKSTEYIKTSPTHKDLPIFKILFWLYKFFSDGFLRKSITDKISLLEALMMDKNISKNFMKEEIEFCLNPKNYLGAAPRMAEELLKNIKWKTL